MPRLISAPFFSANPVFRRAEYAAAVGRRPQDRVVTAMLAQHLQAGNIRRIARGVFASVPKHADAATWSVDRFLAASRLRQCSTIAYHSALELQGYAYTEGHDVQVIAQGEPGLFEAAGFACRFVRPPRGFAPPDGVMAVERMGQEVRVTTIERTIADLFDRYDLAGGRGGTLQLSGPGGADRRHGAGPLRARTRQGHRRRRHGPLAGARAEAAGRSGYCA